MPRNHADLRRSKLGSSTPCLAVALAAALLLGTASAPAVQAPVFLGAIGVGKAKPEVGSELRALLSAELTSADFTSVKSNERYVLSATLVRLDSTQSADSVRATCVVSLALMRANGATLYAVIHGHATAEETKAHVAAARTIALRAAVHSAMVRVPLALH